jgi:hypothetical protein
MNISFKVLDQSGAPLTGANAYYSDASGKPVVGGIATPGGTGGDGSFSLNTPDTGYISVSYVGFKTLTMTVSEASHITAVKLADNTATAKEVEITATRLPKPTPWLTYAIIGVGIVAVLGGLYWYFKIKK